MKLPFFLKLDKKKIALFLVLVLRDEKVDAVIFEELAGKVQVIGEHEEYLQNSIDSISLEEFLDVLDKTISKAESSLPNGSEPQKTIFGVKENWIENNKIKKEHLLKLKKACVELGLIPIGFLIIAQAVSYLLQKDEGVPLSAILIDAGKTSITVSLIRSGKIIETKSKNVENTIPDDVDSLLKQFVTQEALPSRIIIFNAGKDLSYEFISHQWSKSLPFLHLPQITNLNSDFPAKAVLFGVATQMGFEVLEDVEKETKGSKENPPQEFENLSLDYFGFIKDKDIAEAPLTPASQRGEQDASASQQKPTPFKDVLTGLASKSELKSTVLQKSASFFGSIKSKIPKSLPSLSLPSIPNINKKALFILSFAVILLIGSVTLYLFGIKATIFLDITPKIIKQNNNITFSTTLPTNATNSIVLGKSISVSLEGEVSTQTSGKKEVGTTAKGTVTIFNNTNASKTFPKGTTITSSNDLNFTLEENITVASASGDVFSGTTPGKVKVDVIAGKIGTEFNLLASTKFSIGDNPSIAAKNDDPFSGGTKKELAVVSKNDIDKLLEELPKKLQKIAEEELPKQVSKDETLLPLILATSITKKDFDKEINDEADRISLKGTVVYKALSYNKKGLISQSATSLKKNVSKDQILDENNIKIDVKNIKQKNEKEVDAFLSLEAMLKPKVDEKKLIAAITGIAYKDAKKVLMELPQVANVRISSSLDIPFLPKMLPRFSKNIKIIVDSQ